MYTYVNIYMYMYVYVYIYVRIYIYIYVYIYIYNDLCSQRRDRKCLWLPRWKMCTTATLYTHKDVFFVCFVQMCQCRLNIVAFECASCVYGCVCVCVRACCACLCLCVCVCALVANLSTCVCVCARVAHHATLAPSTSSQTERKRTRTHKHSRLQRNHLDNAFGPYNPLQATAEFQRLPELQSAAPGAACKSCEIPPL